MKKVQDVAGSIKEQVASGQFHVNNTKNVCGAQGQLSGDDLSAAYASGDVFMMPSESETLGFVALEAMASGLPVVAVAAGGLTDILTNPGVTGQLFTCPALAYAQACLLAWRNWTCSAFKLHVHVQITLLEAACICKPVTKVHADCASMSVCRMCARNDASELTCRLFVSTQRLH